jgi:cytochrome c oxidase cbb3-type subunit 3
MNYLHIWIIAAPPSNGWAELSHPMALLLICIAIGLLIAIGTLAFTVISAMDLYRERMRKGPLFLALLLFSSPAFAQESQSLTTPIVPGLSNTVFWMLIAVIAVEILVLLILIVALRVLAGIQKPEKIKKIVNPQSKPTFKWLEKLNATKSVDAETEAAFDLGHDYDGIRELDNPTPPWWRYGFIFSFVFAIIYMWRYHVVHAAPLPAEEYAIEEQQAALAREAYLKQAANNLDENTVTLLTDPIDLEIGSKLYLQNCAACHGALGEGTVGPNLTDNYWIHGGSISAIFSTIKYGVPEKGMISWKDNFAPKQIAQISSYIKSLAGTNPPNAKEAQGNLEENVSEE